MIFIFRIVGFQLRLVVGRLSNLFRPVGVGKVFPLDDLLEEFVVHSLSVGFGNVLVQRQLLRLCVLLDLLEQRIHTGLLILWHGKTSGLSFLRQHDDLGQLLDRALAEIIRIGGVVRIFLAG